MLRAFLLVTLTILASSMAMAKVPLKPVRLGQSIVEPPRWERDYRYFEEDRVSRRPASNHQEFSLGMPLKGIDLNAPWRLGTKESYPVNVPPALRRNGYFDRGRWSPY